VTIEWQKSAARAPDAVFRLLEKAVTLEYNWSSAFPEIDLAVWEAVSSTLPDNDHEMRKTFGRFCYDSRPARALAHRRKSG
jgi:hypothetical protein